MSCQTLTVALFVALICLDLVPNIAALQRRCLFPSDSGSCSDSITMFAYDARVGDCVPFVYSGCGGNDNRFPSMDECMRQCGWKYRLPK
ncbi:protease inhibitor [Paragonimus heterotremus]|uniref:Protease inhibitor n=1 Tax=Paragonimus heterotremus TaxID=100268 RepID=A0A8J4SPN0_9TREM|nr:protease inhibitor [Paragonimus heterotremus]